MCRRRGTESSRGRTILPSRWIVLVSRKMDGASMPEPSAGESSHLISYLLPSSTAFLKSLPVTEPNLKISPLEFVMMRIFPFSLRK